MDLILLGIPDLLGLDFLFSHISGQIQKLEFPTLVGRARKRRTNFFSELGIIVGSHVRLRNFSADSGITVSVGLEQRRRGLCVFPIVVLDRIRGVK
jgi:hypothetical protein